MSTSDEFRDPELERVRDACEPPPPSRNLQERVTAAYEREFRGARLWRRWFATRVNPVAAASAALAVVLLVVFAAREMRFRMRSRVDAPAPLRMSSPVGPPAPQVAGTGQSVLPGGRPIPRISRRTGPVKRELRGSVGLSQDVVTEFFPLMDAPPPLGRGVVVRTLVPVTMMRAAGLRGWEESLNGRVRADILIGEEGLPRAIRFVGLNR